MNGFGQTNPKLNFVLQTTYAATVTLVGGAGNTVPQYSTNTGLHAIIAGEVFVDVYLTGDGGNEGAGTGQINIALPVAANASHPAGEFLVGMWINGASKKPLYGTISASGTTIALSVQGDTAGALNDTIVPVLGNNQNNTTRSLRLHFSYKR